jgi:hypothetical protein
MLRHVVWQLVQDQSDGKPWIRIDNNNIGIETPMGRTRFQRASLDVTSPRASHASLK